MKLAVLTGVGAHRAVLTARPPGPRTARDPAMCRQGVAAPASEWLVSGTVGRVVVVYRRLVADAARQATKPRGHVGTAPELSPPRPLNLGSTPTAGSSGKS